MITDTAEDVVMGGPIKIDPCKMQLLFEDAWEYRLE